MVDIFIMFKWNGDNIVPRELCFEWITCTEYSTIVYVITLCYLWMLTTVTIIITRAKKNPNI